MPRFRIRLAGRVLEARTLHDFSRGYCERFLTDAPAEFCIRIAQVDIDSERERSALQDAREGMPARSHPDGYLESLALCRAACDALIAEGVLLFHASAVQVDGRAFLFTAPSGTGKSTHARLWSQLLGDDMGYINDDKPLLEFTDEGIVAHGSPWDGKHRLGEDACAPVAAVVQLYQAPGNTIVKLAPEDAFGVLYSQAYRPQGPAGATAAFRLAARMAREVPVYRMGCTPTLDAARLCFKTVAEQ